MLNNENLKKIIKETMMDEDGIGSDLFYNSSLYNDLLMKKIEEIKESPEEILKDIFEHIVIISNRNQEIIEEYQKITAEQKIKVRFTKEQQEEIRKELTELKDRILKNNNN